MLWPVEGRVLDKTGRNINNENNIVDEKWQDSKKLKHGFLRAYACNVMQEIPWIRQYVVSAGRS